MLRLGAAMAVCAVAGFFTAYVIAGAGNSAPAQTPTTTRTVGFTDPAAKSVAARFTARPAPLKLPPRPRKKHHAKPAAPVSPAPATAPPTTTTPTTTTYTQPAPTYVPPPVPRPRHRSGTGTGTTTIG